MSSSWDVINPDHRVDVLPQPFRTINKIVEEILEAVGQCIDEVAARRKKEEYEHDLPNAAPSTTIPVPGSITCAATEPRGMAHLVLGTSGGEVWLINTRSQEIVAQRHAFGEGEAVGCVAICSDATYGQRPLPEGQKEGKEHPHKKVVTTGRTQTPRIHVFDVRRHAYGVLLEPACAIHVPAPSGDEEQSLEDRPFVEQLYVRGADDGLWVVALMWDQTVRVYLAPLGPPESEESAVGAGAEGMLDKPIMEDEEEEEDGAAQGGADEFAVQVKTPTYCIALKGLALLPELPEPGLDNICLSLATMRPEMRSLAKGTAARRVPLNLLVSSPESNIIFGFTMRPLPPLAAPAGLDVDALVKLTLPPLGDPREVDENPQDLRPRRRWEMPGQTTAAATSPCGTLYAAGGAKGSLALIDLSKGLFLTKMLAGHYGAVAALSFHRSDILVSAGADSWIHHYRVSTGEQLARYLCAPPAIPPKVRGPAGIVGLDAAQSLPVAISLDARGGMRLLDLRHGRKMARAAVVQGEPGPRPRSVLATATGFCVLCAAREDDEAASEAGVEEAEAGRPAPEEEGEDDEEEGNAVPQGDRACLVVFDYVSVLKRLYPTLAGRADRGLGAVASAFNGMSLEAVKGASGLPQSASDELLAAAATAAQPAAPAAASAPGAGGNTRRFSTSRGSVAQEAPSLAALTAENLRRIGKPGGASSDTRGSVRQSSGRDDGADSNAAGHAGGHAGGGPQNWQVSVRRFLRNNLSDKEARKRRMRQRLDTLQKDLEAV